MLSSSPYKQIGVFKYMVTDQKFDFISLQTKRPYLQILCIFPVSTFINSDKSLIYCKKWVRVRKYPMNVNQLIDKLLKACMDQSRGQEPHRHSKGIELHWLILVPDQYVQFTLIIWYVAKKSPLCRNWAFTWVGSHQTIFLAILF